MSPERDPLVEELRQSAAFLRGFVEGHPANAEQLHITVNRLEAAADLLVSLQLENERLLDVVKRIRQWDMLDATHDGPFWKRELDAALSTNPDRTEEGR